jgi:hypothetical protein
MQIMHIGSYDYEGPTIHRMHHEFMPENGYEPASKHHEIDLGDPRKVAPEKLRTVLRQPVRQMTMGAIDMYHIFTGWTARPTFPSTSNLRPLPRSSARF